MLYNKSRNQKVRDKKVLHKVKKRWVVMSSALLMALGGYAATHTAPVHADANGQNNPVSKNINSNLKNVSQLTSQSGKALNTNVQGQSNSSISATSGSNVKVIDQAHQLHSQIVQNSVMNRNQVNPTNSVNDSQNNESEINQNHRAEAITNPHQVHNLGERANASDIGFISILYKDVDQLDKSYGQIVSQQNNPQPGVIGSPFTKAMKDQFINEPPKGYIDDPDKSQRIVSDVTQFTSNPQQFVIGVVPKVPNNVSNVHNRIIIEYEDDTNGDAIINKPDSDHWTWSDQAGQPFETLPYEVEVPQGYSLDMKANEEISNEHVDGSFSSDRPVPPLVDPRVTYEPGNQLIQIRIKPAATMYINYYDPQTKQNVRQYSVTGATGNDFDITPFEYGRVPKGYSFTGHAQGVPTTYIKNAKMTIDVSSSNIPSSNNSHQHVNSIAWATVDFIAQSGPNKGQQVGQYYDHGAPNSPLNVNQYGANVPAGYHYIGILGNTYTFDPNGKHETVIAGVDPIATKPAQPSDQPHAANMVIQYVDQATGQILKRIMALGNSNEKFPSDTYRQAAYIPDHYHYVSYEGAIPDDYDGSTVSVEIAKNIDEMPVTYVDQTSGQVVGRATATGDSDTAFDPTLIKEPVSDGGYLPYGFKFAGFEDAQPSDYVNKQPVTIYVNKIQNNNSDSNTTPQKQQVTMYIEYQDNGQTIPNGKISVIGDQGDTFDPSSYENNVPAGYQFAGMPANNVTQYEKGQVVVIDVTPIQTAPQTVQMPVHYMYNGQLVGVNTAVGEAGQSFDPTTVENDAVNKTNGKYQYNGGSINVPSQYEPNATVMIDVDPVPNNNHKLSMGSVTFEYVNDKTHQVSYSPVLSGIVGSRVNNFEYYEHSVPSGTHYVKTLSGNSSMTYTPNAQTVEVEVAPNTASDNAIKYGTITIRYRDINSGKMMTNNNYPTSERIGTPFSLSGFDNAPAGYHIVGVYSDESVDQYTLTPQSIILNVAPDVNPKPTPTTPTKPSNFQNGKITLIYMDSGGNVVGPYDTFTQKAGTPFNAIASINANMPSGYHFVQMLDGTGVTQYNNGNQYVSAEVAIDSSPQHSSDASHSDHPIQPQPSSGSTSDQHHASLPQSSVNNTPTPATSGTDGNGSSNTNHSPSQPRESNNHIGHKVTKSVTNHSRSQHNMNDRASSNQANSRKTSNVSPKTALESTGDGQNEADQFSIPNVTSFASVSNGLNQNESDDGTAKLPQTGESNQEHDLEAIASILATIGVSLTELGYSLKKRRQH